MYIIYLKIGVINIYLNVFCILSSNLYSVNVLPNYPNLFNLKKLHVSSRKVNYISGYIFRRKKIISILNSVSENGCKF